MKKTIVLQKHGIGITKKQIKSFFTKVIRNINLPDLMSWEGIMDKL